MATKTINAIEVMERRVRDQFPTAEVALDRPGKPSGIWHLDITLDELPIVVEWQEGNGFGLSVIDHPIYGDGPDEVYTDADAVVDRIGALFKDIGRDGVSGAMRLREIRKERGISQDDLATLLNIRQGAVSRLERREDMLVSSLRDYIACFGGELQLVARFPDGTEQKIRLGSDKVAKKKA